jgi:hypothetical protein
MEAWHQQADLWHQDVGQCQKILITAQRDLQKTEQTYQQQMLLVVFYCTSMSCSVDTDNCFKLIVHPIALIAFQVFGVPTPAIDAKLTTIQDMKFYLGTGYGRTMQEDILEQFP